MKNRICAALLLGFAACAARAENNVLPSFAAHYEAYWKSINVGVSDLALRAEAEPNHYYYTWTVAARGVFKLLYSDEVKQQSWLTIVDDHVQPQRYLGEEGASKVSLQFDWDAGRVRGTSETKPVDLKVEKGVQDIMSIQVEVMLDLKNGRLPKTFKILEKDQPKDFNYNNEGPAKLKTIVGELDTIVVTSQRTGNNRILRMWFAPSLGYMPVQAERSRDGKLEFAMRLRSMKR
jgi:Protein of unknown function (DUF3108)